MERRFSKRHEGRPKHMRDFDLPIGLGNLTKESAGKDQRIWSVPAWWPLIFVVAIAIFLVVGYQFWGQRAEYIEKSMTVTVLLGVAWSVTLFIFVCGAFSRPRLVLDLRRRELLFFKRAYPTPPYAVIRLSDIRAMAHCTVVDIRSSSDDGGTQRVEYRFVVAELHDTRLVSIAFQSANGILEAIGQAHSGASD